MRSFSLRTAGVALAAIIGIVTSHVGCGGGGGGSTPQPAPAPVITSFSAGSSTIQQGDSTTLTAVFSNGTGMVTNSVGTAVGAVTSGVAKTISPASTTTYTLTVTNTDGNTVSQTAQVAVQSPNATITAPSSVVLNATFDASVPAQVDAASTFLWTITGGTPSSATTRTVTITPTAGATSITISCVVTNSFGATASSGNKAVTVTLPTADTSITVSSASVDYKTPFTASVPANTGGTGTPTFKWVLLGGTITTDPTAQSVTCLANYTGGSGNVTLKCTVTNGYGSSATGSKIVTVQHAVAPTISSFTAGQLDLLKGESTTMTPVFANGVGTINAPGIGTVPSGSTVTVTPPAGTTTYFLKVENEENNAAFKSLTFTVHEPQARISVPLQVLPAVTFTASVPNQYDEANHTYTYAWTVGSGATLDSGQGTKSISCTVTGAEGSVVPVSCLITNQAGGIGTGTINVHIDQPSAAFSWPSYSPDLNYSFKDEFPGLQTWDPQNPEVNHFKIRPDSPGKVAYQKASGWWSYKEGPNANALLASHAAVDPMLARYNKDFAVFRDQLGWPPDKGPKLGYYSGVYLYGSGLSTDSASNTATGGWQGTITWAGETWGMVLASYYPVYCFDPACTYSDGDFQRGAMIHEGIHSVLSDLPGGAACWWNEGGNTWLQAEGAAYQASVYQINPADLDGASFMAPFMPVECYSGWLQDGSFGGPCNSPSADYIQYQQSTGGCFWRNYLGGVQYSNTFPKFLGTWLSKGSVAWVWKNATGYVLEGLSQGLGDEQTRRLVMEFRAKQALCDMGNWSDAFKGIVKAQLGVTVKEECTNPWHAVDPWYMSPYVRSTVSGNVLTPEARTLPGWSGANQIPLTVATGATSATVTFNLGANATSQNMTCQLVYPAKDGTLIYSYPSYGAGTCTISWANDANKAPRDGVVIAVVSNTDYIYASETTRTLHFGYTLTLGAGISGKAKIAENESAAGSYTSSSNKYYVYF